MKKKLSPKEKENSQGNHAPRNKRSSQEVIELKRPRVEPAVLAVRKVSSLDRPPTPYEIESSVTLGPVFVPNKFMNGSQSYAQYARAVPSSSWHTSRPSVISKVEVKPGNLRDAYRSSKVDLTGSLPAVDKRPSLKLSTEELGQGKRTPFLPKIEGKSTSKKSLGSYPNLVESEQGIAKRSPHNSFEKIKLPPAKICKPNILTCKGITPTPPTPNKDNNIQNRRSQEELDSARIVPKPPSGPKPKDKMANSHASRRRTNRRKGEARSN